MERVRLGRVDGFKVKWAMTIAITEGIPVLEGVVFMN